MCRAYVCVAVCMHLNCLHTVVGSNAQCLRLRINGGLAHIDCMHIANLIGCVLAPILARPFLTTGSIPHSLDGANPVDIGNIDVTNASNVGTIYADDVSDVPTVYVTDVPDAIRWSITPMARDFANTTAKGVDTATATDSGFRFGVAYFIAASLLVASGVAAITLSLALPRRDVTDRRDTSDKATQRRRRPAEVCLRVACLYAVFQCIQVAVESTYGCLILSYAVKGIGWSKASAIGRGLCLTVVSKASATACIFAGMCTVLTSLLVTMLFGRTHPDVMWLTTTMQGVASSTVLPACIIWRRCIADTAVDSHTLRRFVPRHGHGAGNSRLLHARSTSGHIRQPDVRCFCGQPIGVCHAAWNIRTARITSDGRSKQQRHRWRRWYNKVIAITSVDR